MGAYEDHTTLTAGSVQTNIFVRTISNRYVLRYYEQGRSFNAVLFEVNLLNYLKRRTYPCPAPIRNKRGDYVGMHTTKPYVLFEFLEGEHVQHLNKDQQQQLIKKVAELHTITAQYRPAHTHDRLNYSVETCGRLAEQAARTINTANAREKLQWLKHELSQLDLPSSLPKGVCHCDFHFSNVLFKDDSFAALLDFDDANYTFLLFDLSGLIASWACPYDHVALDFVEARKIVSVYHRYRPLNNNEQRHLFDVYKLSILIDCVWYFGRGDVRDFYERRKIEQLNSIGKERFYNELFTDV